MAHYDLPAAGVKERPSANGRIFGVELRASRRPRRLLLVLLGALLVAIAVAAYVFTRVRTQPITYTTAPLRVGSLAQAVTATGTVSAQNTISVGTQVSGTIAQIFVDYNSRVRAGQVLARLDPTTLRAAVAQQRASLAQSGSQAAAGAATASAGIDTAAAARAQVEAARQNERTAASGVVRASSAYDLARVTVRRDEELLARGFIARSQADTDRANLVAAQTTLASARIALEQAGAQTRAAASQARAASGQQAAQNAQAAAVRAAVDVQRAQLDQAQANLDHSIITSPVDGTVVARNVSVGQTVAASFQTPTLFTIAQDLTKMEVDLAVGEPDIGSVTPGDPVDFTVLAYPNRVFHAVVSQVRQNPTTIANVVTYTAVLYVGNRDGALRPGMTAAANVRVGRVDGATIVPLTALQYQPPSDVRRAPRRAARPSPSPAAASAPGRSPWGAVAAASGRAIVSGARGRVFVLRGGAPVAVPVQVGLVADTEASVRPLRDGFRRGDAVVVGDSRPRDNGQTANAAGTNPFAPPRTGGGRAVSGR